MPATTPIRPALGVQRMLDDDVEKLAIAVHDGVYGNPNYVNPSIEEAVFQTAIDKFAVSIVAAKDGGKKAIAEKQKQREIVTRMLRQLGHFVEANCKDDMSIFLSSGYQPVSTTRTKQPVTQPHILGVDNGNAGELIVRVKSILNAHSFEVRYVPLGAGGTPGTASTAAFTDPRSMSIKGLTPGTVYTFQVRALGALGHSDWSDFASRMCI